MLGRSSSQCMHTKRPRSEPVVVSDDDHMNAPIHMDTPEMTVKKKRKQKNHRMTSDVKPVQHTTAWHAFRRSWLRFTERSITDSSMTGADLTREATRILSSKWKAMTPTHRQPYDRQAREANLRADAEHIRAMAIMGGLLAPPTSPSTPTLPTAALASAPASAPASAAAAAGASPPTTDAIKTHMEAMAEEFTCAICVDLINRCTALQCGHLFCHACVTRWLSNGKAVCPTCSAVHSGALTLVKANDNVIEKIAKHALTIDEQASRNKAAVTAPPPTVAPSNVAPAAPAAAAAAAAAASPAPFKARLTAWCNRHRHAEIAMVTLRDGVHSTLCEPCRASGNKQRAEPFPHDASHSRAPVFFRAWCGTCLSYQDVVVEHAHGNLWAVCVQCRDAYNRANRSVAASPYSSQPVATSRNTRAVIDGGANVVNAVTRTVDSLIRDIAPLYEQHAHELSRLVKVTEYRHAALKRAHEEFEEAEQAEKKMREAAP